MVLNPPSGSSGRFVEVELDVEDELGGMVFVVVVMKGD